MGFLNSDRSRCSAGCDHCDGGCHTGRLSSRYGTSIYVRKGDSLMTTRDLSAILDAMHSYIRRDIAAGFETPDEIVDSVVDLFSDEADAAILRPHARRMVREVL